jgi:AbrB family looped-hinge helix DNA binding protein
MKSTGKGQQDGKRVAEAALQYRVPDPYAGGPQYGETRLSSKNQITIPAEMVRALGLRAGDGIMLWMEHDSIVLEKKLQGGELLENLGGSLQYPEWSTKEKVDQWIRGERDSWERDWDSESS